MNKINYKSAIDKLKISEDFNEKTLKFLSQKNINTNGVANKRKSFNLKYVYGSIAACFLLLLFLIPLLNDSAIDLPNSTNIRVKYVKSFPKTHISGDLVWLSEDEIFNKFNTSIFQGEVVDIKNIVIEMGKNNKEYRAIAKIKITESYRGDETPGEIVEVLLPTPIGKEIWVEDTGVVSAMRVGMVGVFMPIKYDKTSIWSENDATLYLMEIAEYGFLDGERFAFLQTENSIVYAEFAFESIPKHPTLDDIEAYVLKMINHQLN